MSDMTVHDKGYWMRLMPAQWIYPVQRQKKCVRASRSATRLGFTSQLAWLLGLAGGTKSSNGNVEANGQCSFLAP